MNERERKDFINQVYALCWDDSYFAQELINAATAGLLNGLKAQNSNLREQNADLAFGYGWLVEKTPKITAREKGRMVKGLHALYNFFRTAPFAEKIKTYLE